MLGLYRFLLSGMVVGTHFLDPNYINNELGYIAVFSFFLISGYLMFYMLETKYLKKVELVGIYNFYKKRFFRIYPFHFITLIFWIIAMIVIGKFEIENFHYENIIIIGSEKIPYNELLNSPIWSLSLEIKFYILVPLLFILYKKFNKYFLETLLLFSLFILLYNILQANDFKENIYYSFINNLFIFILGVYIYKKFHNKLLSMKIFIILLTVFIYNFSFGLTNNTMYNTYIGVCFTALILPTLVNYKFNNDLYVKIDKFLGDLSYGIFIVHVLVGATLLRVFESGFFLFLFTLITSIMIASLLNRYIEPMIKTISR